MSHILIIEDDQDLLNLFRIALSKKGREITTLDNGIAALDVLNQPECKPDAIFLDVNLNRGISGYGILRRVRNDERLKDVPVIIVTADDMHKESALNMGAQDFLVKPVRIVQMAALANQVAA